MNSRPRPLIPTSKCNKSKSPGIKGNDKFSCHTGSRLLRRVWVRNTRFCIACDADRFEHLL